VGTVLLIVIGVESVAVTHTAYKYFTNYMIKIFLGKYIKYLVNIFLQNYKVQYFVIMRKKYLYNIHYQALKILSFPNAVWEWMC